MGMRCYYHPHRYAVAQCPDCGKGLCKECASKFKKPICRECNKQRGKDDIKSYAKPLVVCFIMFIIGYLFGNSLGEDALLMGYIFTCIYGGWSIVNMFFANIFISLDLHSILMYYGLKIVLSAVIGVFATPVFLGYCIYKIIRTLLK